MLSNQIEHQLEYNNRIRRIKTHNEQWTEHSRMLVLEYAFCYSIHTEFRWTNKSAQFWNFWLRKIVELCFRNRNDFFQINKSDTITNDFFIYLFSTTVKQAEKMFFSLFKLKIFICFWIFFPAFFSNERFDFFPISKSLLLEWIII